MENNSSKQLQTLKDFLNSSQFTSNSLPSLPYQPLKNCITEALTQLQNFDNLKSEYIPSSDDQE